MSPFSKSARDQVGSLGETRLIDSIRRWLGKATLPPPAGIGDDCAVVPPGRRPLLVKVDPIVFGRHFDASVSPQAAGGKLLKRNLSDIAAMGGRPTVAVVALFLDRHTSVRWLKQFHRGLAATARRHGVLIVGGAIAETAGTFAASLTLLGEAGPGRSLTRCGARVGDRIFVTGVLGRSRESGHHHRFQPRLAEGQWLARQQPVRSMIDVSDGVAKDAFSLAPAGCVPSIEPAALPRRAGATLKQAVTDGEDYELLFTVSKRADARKFQRQWARRFPKTRLTRIGSFVPKGTGHGFDLADVRGYEHLRR